VIAALRGACLGGGLQLALAADIRIAAPDTRLSVAEIRYGLVPDMGLTQTLPDLVGIDVAKELTFTGRTLDADEALRLGLVTRLADDPRAEALALAREIATNSPDAVRGAKRLLDSAWRADAQTGLHLEAETQQRLLGSANQLAAVQAALSGESAEFADPG
jgi:enoyl-CoA hydratase/carnithine racemase